MREPMPAYSPRWLSWFFQRLNALPVPFWVISIVIILGLAAARHWVAWESGLLPQGSISAFLVLNPVYSVSFILVWQYLDRRGEQAILAFYSKKGGNKAAKKHAVREFLSLAPLPALLVFAFGVIFGYGGFVEATLVDPQAAQVWPAVSILGYCLSTGFLVLLIYRLLNQIRMMRRLLAGTEADIFNPQRVYALSSYGSTFAVVFFLAYTFPTLLLSNLLVSPGALVSLYAVGVSLIVAFFVPLTAINKRMRENKDQLLNEIGNDLKGVQAKVHKAVAAGKFGEVDKMRGTLSALREEREMIQKIPTWPWQPETLRNLLTPFLIPVIVFLVTRYLGTILGLQ
jgi:hypothetical protein